MNIVVSRYNENLEWTKELENVIIYNKGDKLDKSYNATHIKNVGREGHTFYTYIYKNYDNLSNHTVFLQGNPFDHCPDIIEKLKKIDINLDFMFLSNLIVDCNLSGCNCHRNLPLIPIYEKLFNIKKENMEFKFGSGGQFIVSKRQILKRPKDFYLQIVKMLRNDINPIEGFVMERFHSLIFS